MAKGRKAHGRMVGECNLAPPSDPKEVKAVWNVSCTRQGGTKTDMVMLYDTYYHHY
jgi:hypothetical protein